MLTLIVSLIGVLTAMIAWRSGYAAGRLDGQDGVSAPWPWSSEVRDSE